MAWDTLPLGTLVEAGPRQQRTVLHSLHTFTHEAMGCAASCGCTFHGCSRLQLRALLWLRADCSDIPPWGGNAG